MEETGRRADIMAWDSGNREATTVLVYLPGLGERGDVFARLASAPALAGVRHIVLDYVDWARPMASGERISLETVADRIAAWVAAHTQRPVVLLGHSMGGVLAQLLAERHPELLAKLVDIEGNISREDCTFSGKAVAYSIEEFAAHGFEECERALREDADARTRAYAEGLRACAPTTYHAYAKPLVRISEEETLADRLAKLPMPVLYIAGERGISGRSRAMLSNAGVRVEIVEDAGHWPYLDEPDRCADVLRAFVAG